MRWGARFTLLVLMTAALTGCHGGMDVPDDWVEATDAAPRATPNMQVILCFGPVTSNHSVLRLQTAGGDVLFWDPGGMYGDEAHRRHDLVLVDQPTAESFWAYRREAAGEKWHFVYEWDLSAQRAGELHAVLTDPDIFETAQAGGACCKAICAFFQKHATDLADVPKRWLFPHALARHLWTQPVSRVRVLSKDDDPRVYVRKPDE